MIEFLYILAGLVIGLLSGIFGIGGSIIATPVLKMAFKLPDLIAIATPLPVTIPTALAGIYVYQKSKKIDLKLAKLILVGGLPATILGALGVKVIESQYLMALTGIFVVFTGLYLLKKTGSSPYKTLNPVSVTIMAVVLGVLTGFMSGLLAIGGGIVMVPAFIILFGLSAQEAAATSLLCVLFLAVPGSVVHTLMGNIDWSVALILTCGVIPASYAGSKLALKLRSKTLEIAMGLFLVVFGIYFIFKELNVL